MLSLSRLIFIVGCFVLSTVISFTSLVSALVFTRREDPLRRINILLGCITLAIIVGGIITLTDPTGYRVPRLLLLPAALFVYGFMLWLIYRSSRSNPFRNCFIMTTTAFVLVGVFLEIWALITI